MIAPTDFIAPPVVDRQVAVEESGGGFEATITGTGTPGTGAMLSVVARRHRRTV